MWTYRDWVIDAFNANMPFDRFTIEQIAGDLLPDRTLDQQIASGFNRCDMTTNEGGTIAEENLVNYTRDRTETVSQVWLGLTAGCAVCHDHKFDAFSQKEFYELSAFFNNTTQDAYDGNIKDTPPVVVVPQPEDRGPMGRAGPRDRPGQGRRRSPQEGRPARVRRLARRPQARVRRRAHADPRAASGRRRRPARGGTGQAPASRSRAATPATSRRTNRSRTAPGSSSPRRAPTGAVMARMDDQHDYRGWDLWLEGKRVGTHIIHSWPDDALKVVTKKEIPTDVWTHVFVTYDGSGKAAGVKVYVNGEAQQTDVKADVLKNTIRTEVPFRSASGTPSDKIDEVGDQRRAGPPRRRSTPPRSPISRASAGCPRWSPQAADKRAAAEVDAAFAWWLKIARPGQPRSASEADAPRTGEGRACRLGGRSRT